MFHCLQIGVGLEVGVLLAGEEAGAVFGDVGELTVAEDTGFGVVFMEILEELVEGMLLGLGTGVVRTSFLVQTTFIDDS